MLALHPIHHLVVLRSARRGWRMLAAAECIGATYIMCIGRDHDQRGVSRRIQWRSVGVVRCGVLVIAMVDTRRATRTGHHRMPR